MSNCLSEQAEECRGEANGDLRPSSEQLRHEENDSSYRHSAANGKHTDADAEELSEEEDQIYLFRQRRIKIAKLANFFGVGYEEIQPSIVIAEPEELHRSSTVRVKRSSRFWIAKGRTEVEHADMSAVREQLRGLRAG